MRTGDKMNTVTAPAFADEKGRIDLYRQVDVLNVSKTCWFEDHGHGDISLCYIERATDHWSSDSETGVDIDKVNAKRIIGWLQAKFNLETP